jgi:hypothetical protein
VEGLEDSIFHEDGTLARGPIAVCEGAGLRLRGAHPRGAPRALPREGRAGAQARAPGRGPAHAVRGAVLGRGAGNLRDRARRRQAACRVRSSNAGHALWCGIASDEHARIAGRTLLSPDSFSGGAFAPSRRASPATTRCRTTTARSGRTTTRSSPWASRATA